MRRRSLTYRPAHSAHGSVYWTLLAVPLAFGRAANQVGARRLVGSIRPRGKHRMGASPAPPDGVDNAPAPPPVQLPDAPRPWRMHEGRVTPEWDTGASDASIERLRRRLRAG
jgi:hypothetical protein